MLWGGILYAKPTSVLSEQTIPTKSYFQGENNAIRRAPNDFFPRSVGTFHSVVACRCIVAFAV